MAEYIEREALRAKAVYMHGFGKNKYVPLRAIEEAPAVDVAPVVHGEWERTPDGAARCTACKRKMNPSRYGYAFCSLCGARMDGEG